MEIITNNAKQTQKAGSELAKEIIETKKSDKNAFIIAMQGDLGSGKTTFIQGVAKGLGIVEQITSPTFVIMKKYNLIDYLFFHIDCYRLESSKDILDLGFEEMISRPENFIVIEWAERIKDILPDNTLWIKFEYINKNKRGIWL
ncbi:tRNA (adenosine(37)-N6)-threonylcarbamoyltransferase complex ATPase subunit type 1 TsaE [Patescibacteria group bacterium]